MAIRIDTIWPTFIGHRGNPPTYQLVYDGIRLSTIYKTRAAAEADAEQYRHGAALIRTDSLSVAD